MFSQAVSSDIRTRAPCPVSLQPTSVLLVVASQQAQARAVPAFATVQSVTPARIDAQRGMLERYHERLVVRPAA